MTNAFDSMDLNTAYGIAGGYIEADDEIFAKALEMVKADDPRFAEELKAARKAETSLKAQQDKEEEIAASAEEVLDNTSFLKQEFGNDKFQQDFFADEEIKAAEKNTPVYDINPETQERFELEGDDKHAHFEMLFEKAKLDVWREQAGSKEFYNLKNKDKKKSLFAAVKNSFLSTVAHLRTSAQIEREVPDAVHAAQKEDKNFFAKQAGSMLSKIQNALNPDKEIKISSSSVMAACAESEARTNKFARKLADLAKKATGKKKECFSKAALMTHKAKEAFAEKAKLVWGQRYEFMANIRDRAPKIVTDMAATGVLVGATALSAPWLGTAVIGYGAYKAASAWVWPIVTHARKEARLAQKDAKAPKMKFWDRLKKSADTVTSSKEYYKEAGWGCAAGLLGLGAAGIASGAGANVLLQKSFQRLSSTAVYTANSLTNAVKKLKEKDGNWWGKGMAVASTMVMAYVLTSCGENTEETLRMPQNNGGMPDLTGDGNKTLAVADTTNTVQRQTVQAVVETTPTISVPENWESRTGVAAADGTSTSGARAVAEDEFTFTEIPGTTTQVTDSSSVSGETITLSDKSDATAAVLTEEEYTSEEVQGSSRVVTPGTDTEIKSSGLRNEDIMQTDAPAAGVTEQIVADSDEIAAGTPAADNVPERGGYQNTGLTEAQYHRTETFFKNKFGENAFDDYMNRITDDMRAKGGMFEGLSKAQALYSVQQMTAWSNDQHGAFAKEISTMIEYLKGECKDTITVSESGAIKTVIDKVNENGTIDGVTGSTNKVVRYFQANDCGEHGTYAINESTATSEITQPSGNKFKRFFKKMWNTSPEPVFEEIEGTSRVVERVQVAETVVDPQIKVIQANNLDEGKVIGTANADDISSVRADNVEVVIGSEQAPTEVSANEAAAEEAKRRVSNKVGKRVAQAAVESNTPQLSPEAAAALRESGRDPSKLTNPALIKWANETYRQ